MNEQLNKTAVQETGSPQTHILVVATCACPRWTGWRCCAASKRMSAPGGSRWVMVTSSKEDRDVMESYDHGVNSYINKPVEFNEFAKVVSELGYYWLFINRPPIPVK